MIKFSNKSWHFKLANLGERRVWASDTLDICTYIKYVASGTFFVLVIAVLSLLAVGVISFALYENVVWFMGEQLGPVGFVFDVALVLILSIVVIELIKIKYRHWKWIGRYSKSKKRSDSFVPTVYRKFKHKTCFKITIED